MTRPTTPQPTPEPDRKRASPVPSDETLAIRALRDLRKLDARIAKSEQETRDLLSERDDYLKGLSAESKRILATLMPKAAE